MKRQALIQFILSALFTYSAGFAAERIGPALSSVGPQVDITLKNGETNTGQLISFSEGSLSLKLDNGSVINQESESVVSVRFISTEKKESSTLTAQETELNVAEMNRLYSLRWRDNPVKVPNALKQPLLPLTESEKADLTKLRARADIHIKALELEVQAATTDEAVRTKLHELGRYYFYIGLLPQEIRTQLHIAVMKIKNPDLERRMESGMNVFWSGFVEKHRSYKPFERMYEKLSGERQGDAKPPVPGDKPPAKPNAN